MEKYTARSNVRPKKSNQHDISMFDIHINLQCIVDTSYIVPITQDVLYK